MSAVLDPTAYNPYEIPEAPEGESRFALTVNPSGNASHPIDTFVNIAGQLVSDRRSDQEPILAPIVTVSLSAITPAYEIVPRGEVTRRLASISTRPSQLKKCKLKGAALVDSFFLGGSAWQKKAGATDREAYEGLRTMFETMRLTGTRELQDWFCLAILARAGITDIDAYGLPHPNEVA